MHTRFPPQLFAFVVTLLITLLLYGRALAGYFIFDDFVWLECAAQSLNDPLHIFNLHISGFFRPLSHLVFGLLHAAGGDSPALFHGAAWVLHGLCAALMAHLVLRLYGDRWLAVFAALLFALNPLYEEVMLWVSAINEPVSSAMVLLTLIAWLRYLTVARRATLGYALALLGFLLALAAKESAVSTVVLMGLLHLSLRLRNQLRTRRSAGRWLLVYLPFVVLLGAYLTGQLLMQRQNLLVTRGEYAVGVHALPRLARNLWHLLRFTWPPLAAAALCALCLPRAPASRAGGGFAPRALLQGWSRLDRRQILLLLAAVAALMLPYCMFRWALMASRYFYGPALVWALAAALCLRLCATRPGVACRVLALLALLGLVVHALSVSGKRTDLYLKTSNEVRTFVRAAAGVPAAPTPQPLVDGVLSGQHLDAALRLYHPSHSIVFRAVKPGEIKALRGPLWRWDRRLQRLQRIR